MIILSEKLRYLDMDIIKIKKIFKKIQKYFLKILLLYMFL